MGTYNLEIKDYYSLVSLHRSLLEAKFHPDPNDEEISGSPLVSELYNKVTSLLLQSEKASEWENWLQLKNRPDYKKRAVERMKTCSRWVNSATETKREIARNYLSPFIYTEEELDGVVDEVDSMFAQESQPSNEVFTKIENITNKESFIEFLNLLAKDYVLNQPEWENTSVIDFIKAMSSWTEDFSASDSNDVDWESVDYKTMAKILYMGKMYE